MFRLCPFRNPNKTRESSLIRRLSCTSRLTKTAVEEYCGCVSTIRIRSKATVETQRWQFEDAPVWHISKGCNWISFPKGQLETPHSPYHIFIILNSIWGTSRCNKIITGCHGICYTRENGSYQILKTYPFFRSSKFQLASPNLENPPEISFGPRYFFGNFYSSLRMLSLSYHSV